MGSIFEDSLLDLVFGRALALAPVGVVSAHLQLGADGLDVFDVHGFGIGFEGGGDGGGKGNVGVVQGWNDGLGKSEGSVCDVSSVSIFGGGLTVKEKLFGTTSSFVAQPGMLKVGDVWIWGCCRW